MNYNSLEAAPQNVIYHPKYGYISKEALKVKLIRKDINSTHLCVVISLALSMALSVLLTAFLTFFGASGMIMSGIPYYLYYIINMFGSAFTIGMPFMVYMALKNEPVGESLRFRKNPVFDSILLVLAAVSACMLANFPSILISELVEMAGYNGEASSAVAGTTAFESVLYFLTVAVFPPIFEEFAFRGIMLSTLRKHGDAFALIISSLAFALMHSSISSMPFALICGLTLGYIYMRTENLWLSILIHFINNANATLPGILYIYLPEDTVNLISNIIFYGLIVVGVIALVILLIRNKIYFKAESGVRRAETIDLPAYKKLWAYVSSPVAILAILVTVGLIALSMLGY